MVHSLDGSACNNPDCRNRHLKMQQRFLWKCSESCSPWMLASSGWRRCHCMLARKRLQKPCRTASDIGTIINGYFYLAKNLLSFPPIPVDSLTTSEKEEDDNDAKQPAAMHCSSRDPATPSNRTSRNITQGSPTVFHYQRMQKWMQSIKWHLLDERRMSLSEN